MVPECESCWEGFICVVLETSAKNLLAMIIRTRGSAKIIINLIQSTVKLRGHLVAEGLKMGVNVAVHPDLVFLESAPPQGTISP